MFHRLINPLLSNSFFLLGARGTGKTFFLNEHFSSDDCLRIDLLREQEFLTLHSHPERLRQRIEATQPKLPSWVVIDEVQRVPALLNEVHSLIEDPQFRDRFKFVLTGSSARKLKRKGINLLAGRALLNYLYPLTHIELGTDFDLASALHWGSLPRVVSATAEVEKIELLEAYVGTYIKEEIRVEQAVRNLDPFLRFLEVAAQMSGEYLNYSAIGRDCRVDPRMVERYYQILEETLIGFFLEPFHRSIRKRQLGRPKFYFFDLGVVSSLRGVLGQVATAHTSLFGKLFEHFIVLELHRLNSYFRKRWKMSYYATHDGAELDLLLEVPGKDLIAIEIKSGSSVSEVDITKFATFSRDIEATEAIVLCQEPYERMVDGVRVMPWSEGIQYLLG
jgi:predicted AAA+ superfamily ATPase